MNTTLTPVITSAGLNAIWNAQHDGLEATIAEIALGEAGWTPDNSATALKDEKRRIPVAGARVNETQIHLTGVEDGTAEYWVREVGFYLADGTLLAIWSAAEQALAYKSAGVDLLLAFDLVLTALPADSVTVDGSAGFMLPPATKQKRGLIRIATKQEAEKGLATNVAVNPAQVRQIADSRKAADADKLDGHDANYFATREQLEYKEKYDTGRNKRIEANRKAIGGKVSKTGDTMSGKLYFNDIWAPISLKSHQRYKDDQEYYSMGLIEGTYPNLGNFQSSIYMEIRKDQYHALIIKVEWPGHDKNFWMFRDDGNIYGAHGKIVNAEDEAYSIGSYTIAIVRSTKSFPRNGLVSGAEFFDSNIGGDLGNSFSAERWWLGNRNVGGLPGTWRVMNPIHAHGDYRNNSAWCTINLIKRVA